MDSFFQTIGFVFFATFIASKLGLIDFQVCIEPVGQCNLCETTKDNP